MQKFKKAVSSRFTAIAANVKNVPILPGLPYNVDMDFPAKKPTI